jgi:cysteine-rich repeat protein
MSRLFNEVIDMLMRQFSVFVFTILMIASMVAGAAKPSCGDGKCNGGETAASCPADCDASGGRCGDGTCDATEDCSSCEADCGACPPAVCNNDGVCNLGEDCLSCPGDCAGVTSGKKSGRYCCGGATAASLYCEPECGADCGAPSTGQICGNGIIETGEECDDGNTTSGDGCSSTCTIESSVCGNGIVETGEECDDGNTISGDGCDSNCQIESTPAPVPDNQFNIGDSIGEGQSEDGTIGSINHESVWSTGYDSSDSVNSLNERFEAKDAASYYENTSNRDAIFNHAVSGAMMADFVAQAREVVAATANTPTATAGQITFLLGNNDVCVDDLASMTDIGVFENQFRAGLDVLAGSESTRLATIHISSLPAIYWLWESRADTSPFSWCKLFAWPNVPCQDLLAHSGDDCASTASREDPDTIYPGDGANCQRRKQFHARIRDEYNVVLQNVVAEYKNRAVLPMPNLEYVDIFDVRFYASDINGGDCFHPSFAGHQLLSTEEYCQSSWGGGDPVCTQ